MATALLIGVLQQRTGFDLDTPIVRYGVTPAANWSRSGVDYFSEVTTRHLLGQTSGLGLFKPGTKFTYDSDQYLQHLSRLVAALTGVEPVAWATEHFATPLGLPDLYMLDLLGPDISVGGGQMLSCRDAARLGQLVANRGRWQPYDESASGRPPTQLISEEYAALMVKPSFPEVSSCYSLLSWINAPAASGKADCFAARWGCPNNNEWIKGTSLIGDGIVAGLAPDDVGVGMGWLAKYVYFIPSWNTTVVTLGQSWGASLACDIGAAGTAHGFTRGYDDGWAMTLAWRAFGNATRPAAAPRPNGHYRQRALVPLGTPTGHLPMPLRQLYSGARGMVTTQHRRADNDSSAVINGSCTCTCPPGQGFGVCFDGIPNASLSHRNALGGAGKPAPQCAHFISSAPKYCPAVGVPRQCDPKGPDGGSHCPSVSLYGIPPGNCSRVLHGCGPSSSDRDVSDQSFNFEVCECVPAKFSCSWAPQPCSYSPYFPPG